MKETNPFEALKHGFYLENKYNQQTDWGQEFRNLAKDIKYDKHHALQILDEIHQDLTGLIKTEGLQQYYNNLMHMALLFLCVDIGSIEMNLQRNINQKIRKELNEALQLIKSSKKSDISITIKNKSILNKAEISSQHITEKITKLIAEEYDKKYLLISADKGCYHLYSWPNPNMPKGRKPKHENLGYFSHMLQSYLQEYTHLKAEEGISISNQQAKFIYSFMDILAIIDIPEGSYEIDYIRKYLKKYREG